MKFWLIVIITLLGQETFSTAGVMVAAYKEHHNLIIFTTIFFISTIIDIYISHQLGTYLQLKGKGGKIVLWAARQNAKADNFIGARGKQLFLFLLSAFLLPPLLTAFISSWVDITFRQKFFPIFIGNILWYLYSWAIVLSVGHFFKDVTDLLIIVFIALIGIIFIQRFIAKKYF